MMNVLCNFERVVIVGQGYVGLPLAMRAVSAGFNVIGVEADEHRVEALLGGRSFVEGVSDDEVADALSSGRYTVRLNPTSLDPFDVAVISVPTPLRDGEPFLGYVEGAAHLVGTGLRPGALVVLESTTYPGTTEEVVAPILESASGLRVGDFLLSYSPERIDPGNPTWTLERTPKLVSGVDRPSLEAAVAFFEQVVETVVPVSAPAVAELAKLFENTFRHVNIALANEMAIYAHDLGIDIWEVLDAAETKPFGFLRFSPGPGVGGHCLPIDPSYLSWRVRETLGESFKFVELANEINRQMPAYIVYRIGRLLGEAGKALKGARIVVLGLAYKPDTSDPRESPAVRVVELLEEVEAEVVAVDPLVSPIEFRQARHVRDVDLDVIQEADVVALLVDHSAFDLSAVARSSRRLLDTRGRLRGAGDGVEML